MSNLKTDTIKSLATKVLIEKESAKRQNHLARVCFLIGAGCSRSAGVKLAGEIAQDQCIELAKILGAPEADCKEAKTAYFWLVRSDHLESPVSSKDANELTSVLPDWGRVYAELFTRHFSSPGKAHEIFESYLSPERVTLNLAHLILGEMGRQKAIATVLTTNFDSLVLEGAIRSGVRPIISDTLESSNRIVSHPKVQQIIHLHGSQHSYQLANSQADLNELERRRGIDSTILSVFQHTEIFIVVGYAGNERPIINILIDAAKRFPNKHVYWIAYEEDAAEISANAREFLGFNANARLILNQDADEFFLELAQQAKIGFPKCITEPLEDLGRWLPVVREPKNDDARNLLNAAKGQLDALKQCLAKMSEKADDDTATLAKAEELALAGKVEEELVLLQNQIESGNLELLLRFAARAYEFGKDSVDSAWLERSIEANRKALSLIDRTSARDQWAMTQNNLGNALSALGERESGTARLEQAVTAYRAALEEYTRARAPLDWAKTQNNLGTALQILGARENGTARLEQAVTAFRAALEEYTRARVPLNWAGTQNNLGNALQTLGERDSGTARLEEAVTAYRAALEERTRARVPLDWAMTQENLALVMEAWFDKTGEKDKLTGALSHVEAALEVYREGQAQYYIAKAERLRAGILKKMK